MKRSSVVHILIMYLAAQFLQLIWEYNLEWIIVVALFYEVGGSVPFLDELLAANEKFVKFLKRRVDKKRRRIQKKRRALATNGEFTRVS